tara:strand:+ start:1520 stop:2176 length:657 start_codon:yes stop_codon:yes gene_type:complete
MNFLFSSIGKKIQVAISGILLLIFLVFHLFNNLVLFAGHDSFNQMVGFLESIKPLIRIMEAGLLMIILIHTVNAIKLTYSNRTLQNGKYKKDNSEASSLNSRTMAISGTVILIFIFIHLGYIWLTYQTHNFYEGETYYDVLLRNEIGYLNHTPTAIFYIISIMAIGMHLRHGFQSALKTFGFLESKTSPLYLIGFVFWGLIPVAFIAIVLSIQMGFIN